MLATSLPIWDRRAATRASPGYQADSASTVEELGNLLVHGLAKRFIHVGDLKGKSRKTSRLLQAGSRSAGNQFHLGLAMAGNDHFFSGKGCFNKPGELAFGIQHVDQHNRKHKA